MGYTKLKMKIVLYDNKFIKIKESYQFRFPALL